LEFSKNLNSSQRNVEEMKERIESKRTPGINLRSSESESETFNRKKEYLKKKRSYMIKDNRAPTPNLKKDIVGKEERRVYDELINLKVSQAELTKLVINMVHFINKMEKKWLDTPDKNDEEEQKENKEMVEKEEITEAEENKIEERDKKEVNLAEKTKNKRKRLVFKRAPKQSQILREMQIEDEEKKIEKKKRNNEEASNEEDDWNLENVELKEEKEEVDISQLEIFKSWRFLESVSDLNKSAAIVAGRVSEDIRNQVVQTFNPEEINEEKNVLVNQTVQEISFQAKKDYEKEIQEKIKKELEKFNDYIKEKEKEMNEKNSLVSEILKQSAFQPLVDEMKKLKEETELSIKIAKREREVREEEIKKWLKILENIYTQDKEKFNTLKSEIEKKENIGANNKIMEELNEIKENIWKKVDEKIKIAESNQTDFINKNLDYHSKRENELYNLVTLIKKEILDIKNELRKEVINTNKTINPIIVNNDTKELNNMKDIMMNVQQNVMINQKENRDMVYRVWEKNKEEIDNNMVKNKTKLEEIEKKLNDLNEKLINLTENENKWKRELNKKVEEEKINNLEIEVREKLSKLKEEIADKYELKLEKIKKEILENKIIDVNKDLLIQMGSKNPKDNETNNKIIKIEEKIKFLEEKNEEIKYNIKNNDIKIQMLNQEVLSNKMEKPNMNEITVNPKFEPKVEVKIENSKEFKNNEKKLSGIVIEDLNIIENKCLNKINICKDNLLDEIRKLERKFNNNLENLENLIGKSKKEVLKKNEELLEER